jgi:spermidine/putrescine transport system ATP-binding protein
VYLGTDTHVHVRLKDGTPFIVRKQNISGVPLGIESGQETGITFAAGAACLIRD